jgi:hypothetical protein
MFLIHMNPTKIPQTQTHPTFRRYVDLDCIVKLVAENAYIPLADATVPCGVDQIREMAVELLTGEEHAVERQLIYTLAQEKAIGCTVFTYLLAESDVMVLKSTTLEGYRLLRRAPERRRLAAKAGAVCNALLQANFALQPPRQGRTRVIASTVQSRILLSYLPLIPLKSTAVDRPVAEAVVDFAIGLRQVAVSTYLKGGKPSEVVHALMEHARDASKELEDIGISVSKFADHIYDEVIYTYYYMRRHGLL